MQKKILIVRINVLQRFLSRQIKLYKRQWFLIQKPFRSNFFKHFSMYPVTIYKTVFSVIIL